VTGSALKTAARSAPADIANILAWTAEHFGQRHARVYGNTIARALEDLSGGPRIPGALPREEIGNRLFTLHVARHGRKGRHFVLFRARPDDDAQAVEVLRVLHDAMDLPRHVSAAVYCRRCRFS
jgi:toxin ParE1/3/4